MRTSSSFAVLLAMSVALNTTAARRPAENVYIEVDVAGQVRVDGQDVATSDGDATIPVELASGAHALELIPRDGAPSVQLEFVVPKRGIAVAPLGALPTPARVEDGARDPRCATCKPPPSPSGHTSTKPPVALEQPQPTFPEVARRARWRGHVTLECLIDVNGHVQVHKMVEASHPEVFPAAITAISSWRYRPATLEGQPVAVFLKVQLRYNLAN